MSDEDQGPERIAADRFSQLIMVEIYKVQNNVCTITGRLDEISKGQDAILRDLGRSHEIQLSLMEKNSEQDVKIGDACRDASDAKMGLEGHITNHWQWLGTALAAIPIIGGTIFWLWDKWNASLAGVAK